MAIPLIIIFYIYAEKPGKILSDWKIADWIKDNSKFVSRTTLVCGFFLSILISTVGDYPHPIRTMIDVVFSDWTLFLSINYGKRLWTNNLWFLVWDRLHGVNCSYGNGFRFNSNFRFHWLFYVSQEKGLTSCSMIFQFCSAFSPLLKFWGENDPLIRAHRFIFPLCPVSQSFWVYQPARE